MAPWLRVLEAYLVQALLRTPAFHRGVEQVAKRVHRFRHGLPPEEMGGTKLDQPTNGSFLRHFTEEIQTQLGRAEAKAGDASVKAESRAGQGVQAQAEEEVHGAEKAWESSKKEADVGPKQGFLGEYVGALREQLKGGK